MVENGGDFLVRTGSRSLKPEDGDRTGIDPSAVFAAAEQTGLYDRDIFVLHGRKGRKTWPPLRVRPIVRRLPPDAAEAARERLRRSGQRESCDPSPLAVSAGRRGGRTCDACHQRKPRGGRCGRLVFPLPDAPASGARL